ncbi:MAG: AAA family ATPase [Pseudomonadota bacterium]
MARCVVVLGPPCAGKSTVAARLARARGWPLLAKDHYKELAFDALGWSDRAWSRRVSALAWRLLEAEARRWLAAGASCVLEGNFRAEHAARLRALAHVTAVEWLEVRVSAVPAVLHERFVARAPARHPGHVDAEVLREGVAPEVLAELRAPPPALGLGAAIDVDTTTGFDTAAFDVLFEAWAAGEGRKERCDT